MSKNDNKCAGHDEQAPRTPLVGPTAQINSEPQIKTNGGAVSQAAGTEDDAR